MDKTNYKDVCLAYTCIILKIVFCSTNMHALVDLVKIPTYPCVFMCNLRWQAWRIDKRRWEMQAWIWKKNPLQARVCAVPCGWRHDIYGRKLLLLPRDRMLLETFLCLYTLYGVDVYLKDGKKDEEKKTRDSNAPVESWFKIVKNDILKRRNGRVCLFVRTMRPDLRGRLRDTSLVQKKKE